MQRKIPHTFIYCALKYDCYRIPFNSHRSTRDTTSSYSIIFVIFFFFFLIVWIIRQYFYVKQWRITGSERPAENFEASMNGVIRFQKLRAWIPKSWAQSKYKSSQFGTFFQFRGQLERHCVVLHCGCIEFCWIYPPLIHSMCFAFFFSMSYL